MTGSRKRAMTWTLVALGIVMVALGGVLAATFPWQQAPWNAAAAAPQAGTAPGAAQPGDGTQQGTQPQGPQAGVAPYGYFGPMFAWHGWHRPWYGHGYGYGYGYGPWGFFHGPRFFGGGLLVIVLIFLLVGFFARRRRYWHYRRMDDPLDAEEVLRRSFAEGRITEEEYKSRLAALRK